MEKFPCHSCKRKLHEEPNSDKCIVCYKWYPCKVCNKNVNLNHNSVQCANKSCHQKTHIKCNLLNSKDLNAIKSSGNPFFCIVCIEENIAFSKLSDNEFKVSVTQGINTSLSADNNQLNFFSKEQHNYLSNLNKVLNRTSEDSFEDDDVSSLTNCNYYNVNEFVEAKFDSSKSFSIFHINIHSIQLHFEELKLLLQLMESKLEKGVKPVIDITLDHYHEPISTPSEATKGGTLIYVSKDLIFKPRNDLNIYSPKHVESSFIEIINNKKANSIIGTIYRHPSMCGDEFNEEYLRPLTHKLNLENNKNIYIAGDFNFNLLNVSTHDSTSDFFDLFTSNFLLPVISLPTKINSVNNTLIDNIFTNQFDPGLISGNLTVGISDHLPSFVIIPISKHNHLPKKHNIYKRDKRYFNTNNFLLDLLEIDMNNVIDIKSCDPNKSFNLLYDSINKLLDKHMPLRKITKKEHKMTFKPWITNDILQKINVKNKLYNKYTKCKNPDLKTEIFTSYKFHRNQLVQVIKSSKKSFYQNYFTENNKNLRKIWLGIKEIVNIKSKTQVLPTCLTVNNSNITDPVQISNQFNDYFSNIADNILNERKFHGTKYFSEFLSDPSPNCITDEFIPTDEREIIDLISQLKTNKGKGPNSIPTTILHLIKLEIAKPLASIINLSFSTGIHPDKLKIAQVMPVFKKGSRLETCNYRPISLLSNINKIFEKVMYSRVYNYINKSDCFYPLQFGFRGKHSTNHALISIVDEINEALDKKKVVAGIFVDFQKAFDTVNHEILLKKLSHYGIKGNINNWFRSYLLDRKQFVSILGFNSAYSTIHHGVPQGSVLGPLLFLIYINDLNKAIKFSTTYHFADDTNLLRVDVSYKKLQSNINKDLKGLFNWLLANKISLNVAKTELIYFKKPLSPSPPSNLKIKLNGTQIFPTDSIKYLGIHLDNTLSGLSHCSQLIPKLRRSIGMLAKARYYLPTKELLAIYYATFASHLSYGCQIWTQHNNSFLKKVILLQKNALRTLTFSEQKAHTNPIFKALKILKFKDQVELLNCLFVHDQINKYLPDNFNDYFLSVNNLHCMGTRSSRSHKLFVPYVNSIRYGRHSVKHSCILSWNNMITKFPNTDFSIIKRNDLKKLLTNNFLESY